MRQPIRRHQTPSDAIRRHQTPSDLHRRTARSSSGAVPGGIAQVDGRWNWTVKRTCGEGRGAAVSTCMLEHLHDGRWNWTVKRTSKPRRNQTQSDAIRRNQTQSDAIRLAQAHLETTSQSDAIRRNQTPSDAIRRNQTRTSAPRNHVAREVSGGTTRRRIGRVHAARGCARAAAAGRLHRAPVGKGEAPW